MELPDPRVVLRFVDRHGATPRNVLAARIEAEFALPRYQTLRLIAHAEAESLIEVEPDGIVRVLRGAEAAAS